MHVPDRVLRQFGLVQHVPEEVEKIERKATKGGHRIDWPNAHRRYIERWDDRHFCIVVPLDPPLQESAYISWYWRITRRWIINETEPPLNEEQQRDLQKRYVPRGLDEREFVNALDDIEAIANEGLAQSGRGSSRPLFQRILRRIRRALHRTHEELHDGREVMVQPSQRRRRGSRRNDDEAGPSQHVSGPSQTHTQTESELVQTQLPEGRRRTSRVTGARQRRLS